MVVKESALTEAPSLQSNDNPPSPSEDIQVEESYAVREGDIPPQDNTNDVGDENLEFDLHSELIAIPEPHCHPRIVSEMFRETCDRISTCRGKPLFVINSSMIRESTAIEVYRFRDILSHLGRTTGFDVLLESPGGELGACYRVARFLSRFTDDWTALVPYMAASGATLISLGSSKIVMSDFSHLGPLDPQVMSKRPTKFFLAERQSPLEAFQAVNYLRQVALETLEITMGYLLSEQGVAPQTAVDTANKLAVELTKPILDKIEPYDLGAFAQDNVLAQAYGKRIATPADQDLCTQRNAHIKGLVEHYAAHEFVIDIDEAQQLGLNVERADQDLEVLFQDFREINRSLYQFRTLELVGLFGIYPPMEKDDEESDGNQEPNIS